MTTASVLDRVASHVGRASTYTVCELDGRVVHTTTDSEDATRVLALEPSRRCVVRDGAVLRWGARVTPGERRSAEVFLRRARLLTVLPSTSPDETRAQIAHRDSKPENVTPAPPAEEDAMTQPATNLLHRFSRAQERAAFLRACNAAAWNLSHVADALRLNGPSVVLRLAIKLDLEAEFERQRRAGMICQGRTRKRVVSDEAIRVAAFGSAAPPFREIVEAAEPDRVLISTPRAGRSRLLRRRRMR